LYDDRRPEASLFRLDDKVALITGATRGIGFEIARGLADAGAVVGVHGRGESVCEAAASIPRAAPVAFDLRDEEAAKTAVLSFAGEHGFPDILVCSAGLRDRRTLLDSSVESLRQLLEINLVGHAGLVRLLAPHMAEKGGGSIIFVTTSTVTRAARAGATYGASKGGLDALTRALAVELAPHRIRVNAISPGFIATEFNAAMTQDPVWTTFIESRVPQGRWAAPEELVGPALFLASAASSYVTGHTLVVDGGLTIAA